MSTPSTGESVGTIVRKLAAAAMETSDAATAGAIVRYTSRALTGPERPTNQKSNGATTHTNVVAYDSATPVAPQGSPATMLATMMVDPTSPQRNMSRPRPCVMKDRKSVV